MGHPVDVKRYNLQYLCHLKIFQKYSKSLMQHIPIFLNVTDHREYFLNRKKKQNPAQFPPDLGEYMTDNNISTSVILV